MIVTSKLWDFLSLCICITDETNFDFLNNLNYSCFGLDEVFVYLYLYGRELVKKGCNKHVMSYDLILC